MFFQILREALSGLRPLLCSEDMEVQERAHNASALLALVLRRLSPADAALPNVALSDTARPDSILVEHQHTYVARILPYNVNLILNLLYLKHRNSGVPCQNDSS